MSVMCVTPRLMRCVALAVALAGIAGQASAQFADRTNAATHYQRAFDRFGILSDAEWNLIREYDASSGPPSQAVRDAVRKAQPLIEDFHRGSLAGYSDFHLNHDQGFEMLLPHLRPMRDLIRLSGVDATIRLQSGDSGGAARRLAAVGRSLGHFGDDRTLLSSLVGQAALRLMDQTLQGGIDSAAFNAADALQILQPLQQLAEGDAFNFLESIAFEQEMSLSYLDSIFQDDQVNWEMLGNILPAELSEQEQERWLAMTPDSYELHLDRFDEYMDGVVEVFVMDDPDEAIAAMETLEAEFLASEHNLLAHMCSAYSHVLRTKFATDEILQRQVEALAALVAGEAEPADAANAAVWYLRAIEMLAPIDSEVIDALRDIGPDWDAALPEPLAAMLQADAAGIVHELREGSHIRRCDFSIARPRGETPFLPRYVCGMRDAVRLLHADAIAAMQRDDQEAAAERLAIAYRIIAHLSGDEQLLTALATHHAYEHTHALAEMAVIEQRLSSEQQAVAAAAFARIGRADPFGFVGAVRTARAAMISGIQWRARAQENRDDLLEHDHEVDAISTSDGDRLVTLLALWGEMLRVRFDPDAKPPTRDSLAGLAGAVMLDEVQTLFEQIAVLAPTIFTGQPPLTEVHLPPISDITRRMRFARADLRLGATLWRQGEQ